MPHGVVVGDDGSLYFAEYANHVVRKVDPGGVITTVAGTGVPGYSGDGGPASEARLNTPAGLALGADGSIYIAELYNSVVRRVDPAGTITTVAGTGGGGYSGDGVRATEAALNGPRGVALGPDGSLYIADSRNSRVRRVRWLPCDPEQARARGEQVRAEAAEDPDAWREAALLFMIAEAWDDAMAAAERVLALTPETDEPATMRAQVLAARVYAAKGHDGEARRRLIPILAQAHDPGVLRGAAEALVDLYLLRREREQAVATLTDLKRRHAGRYAGRLPPPQDGDLLRWIDRRLKEIGGE
jgi:hypothetical protein